MPRKKPTKAAPVDRAALLLEAADQLFGEQGYDAVSVGDLAKAAGVNKALVFYYFGSKEELFARVLTTYYEAHRGALERALDEEGPLDARLSRLIDAYFDFDGLLGFERGQVYADLFHGLVG